MIILYIIAEIMFTVLTVLMCRFFIIDIIQYYKQKKWWKIILGIILIIYFIYSWCKALFILVF